MFLFVSSASEILSPPPLLCMWAMLPCNAAPCRPVQLRDMGFDDVEAELALRMFHNHVESAATWLVQMAPMRAALGAAAASTSGAVPQPAGGATGEPGGAGQPQTRGQAPVGGTSAAAGEPPARVDEGDDSDGEDDASAPALISGSESASETGGPEEEQPEIGTAEVGQQGHQQQQQHGEGE